MTDLYATARGMIADLKAKKISARELLNAHLARNDALHPKLNAVIRTDIERAQKDALAIDESRAKGAALGALAGIPMTVKDGYDVENMPATSGNPIYKDRDRNCADADMVKHVRDAGAVIWGKTNVPFMLADLQSYNSVFGTTNNPYDVTRTPGGSSGGAAAALAAGITPIEIGSDIGGSLRHPANFCGVMSLKPTWGVLPSRGEVPPPPGRYLETDLAVVGPLARNTEDLKLMWGVTHKSPALARRDVKGARIAVWDEEAGWPLARDVKEGVIRAASALEKAGAYVERAKPQIDGSELLDAYMGLLIPITSLGLPPDLVAIWEASREKDRELLAAGGPQAMGARQRLMATATYREVARAQVVRQALKDRLAEFFGRYDAIVMPISPTTAIKHQHEPAFNDRILDVDGKPEPYPAFLYWISVATALHAPAITVQTGLAPSGLPVGVQIIGPWHGEDRLFDYAAAVEEALGGFVKPSL